MKQKNFGHLFILINIIELNVRNLNIRVKTKKIYIKDRKWAAN
jgi:hypothetical protein